MSNIKEQIQTMNAAKYEQITREEFLAWVEKNRKILELAR